MKDALSQKKSDHVASEYVISEKMLKSGMFVLLHSMNILPNKFFKDGEILDNRQNAQVVLLYRKGNKLDILLKYFGSWPLTLLSD